MKIPTIQQIREADAYTIQHEPIESIDLMERAARLVYQKMLDMFDKETNILIVCGMGNNGGDGLALARMLLENNYQCSVALIKHSDKFSNDCAVNLERLQKIRRYHKNNRKQRRYSLFELRCHCRCRIGKRFE